MPACGELATSVVLHPLRPAQVARARARLARLLREHARQERLSRQLGAAAAAELPPPCPHASVLDTAVLALRIAAYLPDARSLVSLASANRDLRELLTTGAGAAAIWEAALMRDFALSVAAIRVEKVRMQHGGGGGGGSGGSGGGGSGGGGAAAVQLPRREEADGARAASPPIAVCAAKRLYGSLVESRAALFRTDEAASAAKRLQSLNIDPSAWRQLQAATGLDRLVSRRGFLGWGGWL